MEGAGVNVFSSVFILLSEKEKYLDDKKAIINLRDQYQSMEIINSDSVFMDTDSFKGGNNSIKNQDQRVIVFKEDAVIEFKLSETDKIQYLGFKGYKCLVTKDKNDFDIEISQEFSDVVKKTIEWFNSAKTGASSKALAYHLVLKDNLSDDQMEKADISSDNGPFGYNNHPHDPSDFKRCMSFFEAVPEAKNDIGKMAQMSKEWQALVSNWSALEYSFNTEYEKNKNDNSTRLPETYSKMKYILDSVKNERRHRKPA